MAGDRLLMDLGIYVVPMVYEMKVPAMKLLAIKAIGTKVSGMKAYVTKVPVRYVFGNCSMSVV